MKKVIRDKVLREKMLEAIDLLCDTVKTTLGPKGSNAIIDHSSFSPFITNDGVTIAENIESEDEVVNTILELAKEASIKTNEVVGDGTTTTLVLLQSIFKSGLELIESGHNPLVLKRELDESLKKVVLKIENESIDPTNKQLKFIASTSANDIEIGNIVSDAYLKVQNKDAIKIRESDCNTTEVIYRKGYNMETLLASPYYFQNNKNIEVNSPYILLLNDTLFDLNSLSNILNEIMASNSPLLIVADDYSDTLVNEIMSLYISNKIKIYLFKNPSFGLERLTILNNLSLISNAQICDSSMNLKFSDLGNVNSVKISTAISTFSFENNKSKKEMQLANGIVEIKVGAQTEIERREKKMRYDDAICAISSSVDGIVLGGGVTLYKISKDLDIKTPGDTVLKEALSIPFKQIMINAGVDVEEKLKILKKENYQKIFNINSYSWESVEDTEVIDSKKVVINTIKNAVSIASMLLTTTSLIVNEHDNISGKVNNYTEI
ncbi:MAG: hypothetical protein K2J20_04470 [Bacilli bacterium]|nr:hypothetical protein [Bacilli bacterium]